MEELGLADRIYAKGSDGFHGTERLTFPDGLNFPNEFPFSQELQDIVLVVVFRDKAFGNPRSDDIYMPAFVILVDQSLFGFDPPDSDGFPGSRVGCQLLHERQQLAIFPDHIHRMGQMSQIIYNP